MQDAIVLWIWLGLVVLGYVFGRFAEARHYRSIASRERAWLHLPATSFKQPMDPARPVERSALVHGSAVVGVDYYKRLVASLRSLIGGPVSSFETLIDRARREALLRLKESCPDAHEIVNLRFETASISAAKQGSIGSVEVLAYGTAIYFRTEAA